MINLKKLAIKISEQLTACGGIDMGRKLSTIYHIECVRDGKVVWTEQVPNLVVDAGLNDSLDKHLKGSSYTAAWYCGLTAASPTVAAADTMSSHAGWTEDQNYSESVRQTITFGTVASKSVSNSASKAVFTINATTTIGGAFMATISTKGGTTGTLYGGAAFGANRSVISGDVLNVTITCTAAG
jgi:hypothetical protein